MIQRGNISISNFRGHLLEEGVHKCPEPKLQPVDIDLFCEGQYVERLRTVDMSGNLFDMAHAQASHVPPMTKFSASLPV